MTNREKAEQYSATPFKRWSGKPVEQIEQFLNDCDTIRAEFQGCTFDLNQMFPMTLEQMREEVARLTKQSKRRAGVKALKAKYGHEIADKIVFKHSGRHIR